MSRYAQDTQVSSEQSRAEIERNLRRYGADQFMYGWDVTRAMVMFRSHERHIKFDLPLPDPRSDEFVLTPARRYQRSPADQHKAYEQAVRQRWRALNLAILAKLEAVEAGIATFEDEFMAYIVLPDGSTVGALMRHQIEDAYMSKAMPTGLLPALPGAR